MNLIRFTTGLATVLIAACALSTGATAKNGTQNAPVWPTKPIKLLVGFPGGSTPDMSARTLAEPLSKLLGQPVVVENRPGASGNIAADLVAKANDDHTFGVVINGNLTSAKMLNPKLAFDPATDFSFISLLTTAPLVPSLTEAGITGYNLEVWTALVGPASLPKAVQDKLSAAVVRILREEETRQRLFNQGWRAVGTSPEGLSLRVKDEAAQLGAIIRSRGITVE